MKQPNSKSAVKFWDVSNGMGMMAQHTKSLPEVPTSYIRVPPETQLCHLWSSYPNAPRKPAPRIPKYLSPCHLCGKSGWSFRLLTLVCPISLCHRHLVCEPVSGKSRPLSLALSFFNSIFRHMKNVIKCMLHITNGILISLNYTNAISSLNFLESSTSLLLTLIFIQLPYTYWKFFEERDPCFTVLLFVPCCFHSAIHRGGNQ